MSSIFLRLYFLIVATVLLVGFSLDYLWRNFDPQQTPHHQLEQMIKTNASILDSLPQSELEKGIDKLNSLSLGDYQLVDNSSVQAVDFYQKIDSSSPVHTENDHQIVTFIRLASHGLILQYTVPQESTQSYLSLIFVALFYSIIAVVIFFWIWPLSKDLNRLENAVSNFSEQKWQSKVELPATSSVAHLATAYNQLLDRIRLLIETQQSMSHSISHELRTPLARIRFSLQMAEETEDTTQVKNQLKSIMEDVEEMHQLITELLNFAALEKISVEAKLERGNINLLIENLLARLSRNNPEKQIDFEASQQGVNVSCDSYLMERAIQNLIVNALKFSNQTIKVKFQESEKQYLIVVEDDGPGIPSGQKSLVFDSFVQLPNGSKEQGFGLGLAIVKRVMNLHQGEARVEDSELGGAKFILVWPKLAR